jgi:hypothetical protein
VALAVNAAGLSAVSAGSADMPSGLEFYEKLVRRLRVSLHRDVEYAYSSFLKRTEAATGKLPKAAQEEGLRRIAAMTAEEQMNVGPQVSEDGQESKDD